MNLFELCVKIGVDDQASGKLKDLGGKLGNGLKTAAKIGTAAVGAAAAGITALTKAAVDNYAEYEQLVGGVETLFKDSADVVKKYANEAYKSAGLSANEYMSTVTGFSASLLQSLGRGAQTDLKALKENLDEQYDATKKSWQDRIKIAKKLKQNNIAELEAQMDAELKALKKGNEQKLAEAETANNKSVTTAETQALAADLANQAVIDMADNAAKMGTSMEMIQNAYAGFAKQNYTMLDNLKLGYGGTQSEMQRLIKDAAALDSSIDANSMSFANIVKAINVVQTEMGITGTTALEAGRTISGSVGSMKAAWQNLLTGLADGNADIETLVEDLVTTIVGDGTENNLGVLGNIMPAVKMALKGAAKVVAQSAPIIAEELPKLMEEILPDLASATANLIVALAEQIPSMAKTLVDAAYQIVDEIGNAFAERIPGISTIFENLETVVISLTAAFGAYKLAMAISGIIDTLRKATEGQTLAQTLLNAVMNANPFVLIATLIAGLVAAIITLWNTNEGFRNALISAWEAIKNAAVVVWESIVKFFTEDIPNAFNAVINFVKDNWQALLLFITNPIAGALKLLYDLNPKFREWVDNVWESIKNGFNKIIDGAKTWGKDLLDNFIGGIKAKIKNLKDAVSNVAQTVKDFLGFSEPEKGPLSNFHTYAPDMMDLFAKGIRDNEDVITNQIEKSFDFGERTMKFGAEYGGGYGAGAAGMAYGGTSIGNITINIDGAKYSDEQSLASAIALEIQNMTDRRAAVYA